MMTDNVFPEDIEDDNPIESDFDEHDEEPMIEPEDCEYCLKECEESNIEYEANFYHEGGCWYCEHCNRPV